MFNGVVRRGAGPPLWQEYAKDEENQRLAVIEDRISRKTTSIEELLAERRQIAERCKKRRVRQLKRDASK